MAELTLFGYRSGSSVLHRIDARFKLLFVVLVSLACLNASFCGLALMSGLFVVLLFDLSLRPVSIFKSLRWAFFLLGLIFVSRALSEPGVPTVAVYGIGVTGRGLFSALLVTWRLLLIILAGLFLSSTTRAVEVKAGVQWLLAPIPLVPAGRVATMMGLVLRFLPLVLDQARETVAAQRARGIENRKNPVYRLRMTAIPLLRRCFERADRLALAMEARCYSEQRGLAELSASLIDWFALALVGGLCLASVFL